MCALIYSRTRRVDPAALGTYKFDIQSLIMALAIMLVAVFGSLGYFTKADMLWEFKLTLVEWSVAYYNGLLIDLCF